MPWCLLILAAAAPFLMAQEARRPLLILQHFPGEGAAVIAASRNIEAFPFYSEPGGAEPAGGIPLFKGEILDWEEPRTVVYRFGEAEILPSTGEIEVEFVRLEGPRILGDRVETVRFEPGQKLQVLSYQSEGFYYFRHESRVLSMFAENMRILREPETETWIHLTNSAGPVGWLRIDGKDLRVVDREF